MPKPIGPKESWWSRPTRWPSSWAAIFSDRATQFSVVPGGWSGPPRRPFTWTYALPAGLRLRKSRSSENPPVVWPFGKFGGRWLNTSVAYDEPAGWTWVNWKWNRGDDGVGPR